VLARGSSGVPLCSGGFLETRSIGVLRCLHAEAPLVGISEGPSGSPPAAPQIAETLQPERNRQQHTGDEGGASYWFRHWHTFHHTERLMPMLLL
jgi:hypothetical protein